MSNQIKKTAGLTHPATTFKTNLVQKNYSKNTYQNKVFDRSLLPSPATYYCKQFPNLRIKSEWVKVICPFHDDHNPSLSINMVKGNFICHGCGTKGHDIIAFQEKRYKQSFPQAVTALGAWRRS